MFNISPGNVWHTQPPGATFQQSIGEVDRKYGRTTLTLDAQPRGDYS